MAIPTAESINLFYTEGSSDKVYQVQLVEAEGGWKVNAQNGRRGGTLKPQNKTPDPIDFASAKKIYDDLVKSKKKSGYTEDTSGSVYQDTVAGQDFTGIVPQLLNPLDPDTDAEAITTLLDSPDWLAQEKHDGERRLVRTTDTGVQGINRTGMAVPLPVHVADHFGQAKDRVLVDGEIMGDRYVLFDLLELNGEDLRGKPYEDRLARLNAAVPTHPQVTIVRTAFDTDSKRQLAAHLKDVNAEGVVFKQKNAAWAAGRPASGGSQRKWKFVESATLEAGAATAGKRSVEVLADNGQGGRVGVGKVTIPANHDLPKAGDRVEVAYLYRMPGDGGALFQPVYKGARPDKTEIDTLDSLKVKRETVAPQVRKKAKP